jgi:hypothetical protein
MTPEQKMQKVVEAAGECWHEWVKRETTLETRSVIGAIEYGGFGWECVCGFRRVNRVNWHIGDEAILPCKNPSPTDLNELFRLAEKLGYVDIDFYGYSMTCTLYPSGTGKPYLLIGSIRAIGSTPAEALLNAIFQAVSC